MHEVIPSVRGIQRLLLTNHNRHLSIGVISNCLSAMARHTMVGNEPAIPEQHGVALGGGQPVPYNGNTLDLGGVWSGQHAPPLMAQLEE